MKKIHILPIVVCIFILFLVFELVYPATDLAQRFPSGTPIEVITPGSSPTFANVTINADPYAASWNGDQHAAPKDAIYDKIEALVLGGGEATTVANTGTVNLTLTGTQITADFNATLKSNYDTAYGWGNHASAGYSKYTSNQGTNTTDAVTFTTVNTGQGAYELYKMNQDVDTTASPALVNLTVTDTVYGSSYNGDNHTLTKNSIYDYLHLLDTNDDGDIDTIDATLWATKANTASPTFTGTVTIANNSNIAGNRHHILATIPDPLTMQTEDNELCLWGKLDANITITNLEVTLDATTNEIVGDIKYADTFISLANATLINDFDTTSGVRSDSTITNSTVVAGKCIYLTYDSAPNTAIHQAHFDITFDYD